MRMLYYPGSPLLPELRKKERESFEIPARFQYCHQRDYTFKSSLFCVVGVWILVFLSELFQIPMHLDW